MKRIKLRLPVWMIERLKESSLKREMPLEDLIKIFLIQKYEEKTGRPF
jgi:hypothetical protein